MYHTKTLSLSTLTASLVLLAGCTTAPTATNTNAISNTNTTVNTVTNTNVANQNTNTEVVTNANEAVNNENTNTEQLSEVNTSDWLTYTNEEYGFSFKYPSDWTTSTNDAGVISLRNEADSTDVTVSTKIVVRENVVEEAMDEETALRFEDGREPLPLISEEFISINGLSSYRTFRQLKKGEPIFTPDELNEVTRTAIEYTYLNEDDLFRVWFTIDGENTESFYETVDAIGQSFSI